MSVTPGVAGTAPDRPALVSIVVPALNEAANVPTLLTQFGQFSLDHPRYAFELVVVDDGSTDATGDLILDLADPRARIIVVRLARSFGSHYAISAGLARCAGDCAVVLGADLQEPPELLREFLDRWEGGCDVVWGVRRTRAARSPVMEMLSRSFSMLFNRLSNLANYPNEGPSGVLMDRCVIDEVVRLPEHNRNLLALVAWLGFTQSRVDYDQRARRHGGSRWTRRKMVDLAVDSLVQFSPTPLRAGSLVGVAVVAAGLAYAVLLTARSVFGVHDPSGWPAVIVLLLVLGGAQLALTGVLGEYVWRGVEESRRRPLYVVRDVRATGSPDLAAPGRAPSGGMGSGGVGPGTAAPGVPARGHRRGTRETVIATIRPPVDAVGPLTGAATQAGTTASQVTGAASQAGTTAPRTGPAGA